VAAVQLSSGSDVSHNLEEAVQLVNVAADRGAQYVQLPEYFNFLGPFAGFANAADRSRANHHSNGRARPVTRPDTAPGKSLGGVTD